MKVYREFVRANYAVGKGRLPTDDELATCVQNIAEKGFQSMDYVDVLSPWIHSFATDYGAYIRKKRAQTAAAKRWCKKPKKSH
jgi:hypothetical protein